MNEQGTSRSIMSLIQAEPEQEKLVAKRETKGGYVHHDWMDAQRAGKSVPTDARSSPFIEIRDGKEYRVSGPIYKKGGVEVKVPAIPVDPKERMAHKEWEKRNRI